MWTLFNIKNPWKLGLQAVNLAAFALAAYELYQDPDKLAKSGLDMTVHIVNFLCLRENVDAVEMVLNVALNFTQAGSLYAGAFGGSSRFNQPAIVSVIDALIHGGTAATVILSDDEPTIAPKMD